MYIWLQPTLSMIIIVIPQPASVRQVRPCCTIMMSNFIAGHKGLLAAYAPAADSSPPQSAGVRELGPR